MQKFNVSNIDQLNAVAKEIIKKFDNYKIIAFYGEMGAGKTTLIKEICCELGVNDDVNSPTFTIVNEYYSHNFSPIYHFDFYRIESIKELYEIGFQEYIDNGGLLFFEWAEKLGDYLLDDKVLKIFIEISDNNNRIIYYDD